ncbi:MAG: LysM peptidoglycan-binding domain-containing protein [Planctomycetes bacterium]|nr:LysM peptidoglycan-binding domain-containing protein [Planctomycetota bacterium]
MTRSRISMIVAAAGLVLVGLLAVALFTPGEEATTEDQTAKTDEVTPVDAKPIEMKNPLGYELTVPPIVAKPEPKPEPEIKPEPVKPEPPKKITGGVIDYTIQPGDMISKIAVKHGCKSEDIYKLNDGLNKDTASKIRVGQVIKVPVGEEGAEAVANAGKTQAAPASEYYPERTVTAEPGDTAYSLAIEYYGARYMFRKIYEANPGLTWSDRLKGGEQVTLPAHGTAPSTASSEQPSGDTVQRNSLIPPRK